MTPEALAAAARAIAKADGWTEREIAARAMGPLQWQTYAIFARAALQAVEDIKGESRGPVHQNHPDDNRRSPDGDSS